MRKTKAAKESNPAKETETADREIVTTRVFEAPRSLVFEAWSKPEHLAQWWGPNGFKTTTRQMDFNPGATWRFVMRGPDGRDDQNEITFLEIVKPELLVYKHAKGDDREPVKFQVKVTFTDEGGKTNLTMRMLFESAAERDAIAKKCGAVEGANQTLARLNDHLQKMSSAILEELETSPDPRDFLISREFDAPRELVWNAWTDPSRMAQWWGPRKVTNTACEMDVRLGGAYRIVMRGPDGNEYPLKGVFCEIVEPARLVMTMDCSEHPDTWHDLVNPNRDKSKKPHLEGVQTVLFDDLGGKSRLTIRTRFESAAIRDAMVKIGMTDGWSQSLERLAELLTKPEPKT